MKTQVEKRIKEIFKLNKVAFPISDIDIECEDDVCRVAISLDWGDWKHDHRCMDYVMEGNGFICNDVEMTEEDGDDAYSATHYYEISNEKIKTTVVNVWR